MEIGDLFVVNKADRPGAERLHGDLLAMLHASQRGPDGPPRDRRRRRPGGRPGALAVAPARHASSNPRRSWSARNAGEGIAELVESSRRWAHAHGDSWQQHRQAGDRSRSARGRARRGHAPPARDAAATRRRPTRPPRACSAARSRSSRPRAGCWRRRRSRPSIVTIARRSARSADRQIARFAPAAVPRHQPLERVDDVGPEVDRADDAVERPDLQRAVRRCGCASNSSATSPELLGPDAARSRRRAARACAGSPGVGRLVQLLLQRLRPAGPSASARPPRARTRPPPPGRRR